jgi:hypothetical protein
VTHTEKLLKRLRRNASLAMYAHFGAAQRNVRYHIWLGVPVLLINVLLGSVLTTFIGKALPELYKWGSAVLSLAAAILSALLTFFHFDSGKQKHREIANKYLSIERRAEESLARYRDGVIDLNKLSLTVMKLNNEYEKINLEASNFPTNQKDYQRAKSKMKSREDFLKIIMADLEADSELVKS